MKLRIADNRIDKEERKREKEILELLPLELKREYIIATIRDNLKK